MTVAVPSGDAAVKVTAAEVDLKVVRDIIADIQAASAASAYLVDWAGRLVLCGISGKVRQLFDLGGFLDLFSVSPTRDEAITALR